MEEIYTYKEIMHQPTTWLQTIDLVLSKRESIKLNFSQVQPEEVVFIGCGTSYYISIAAAATFQEQTGITARAVPASDIFLKPDAFINKDKRTLMIASSRSGNTTEVVRAIEFVQTNKLAECISITTNPSSQMAEKTESTIILPYAQDKSVVMTSSFTNLLLCSLLISGIVSNDEDYISELKRLPKLGEQILKPAEDLARKIGESVDLNHFIYLGIGGYLGLAYEGMLKMKEMTQNTAEAFNSLEFRHGPISVLTDKCCVFLLANTSIQDYEQDVVEDVQKLSAKTVVIGDQLEGYQSEFKLDLRSGLSDKSRLVLCLILLQLTAYYRTLKLGLNPDKPKNLNQVVVLKAN
jgi:glucosamine--fructose-6-phosphate aminotransferase (isomerizing)